MAALVQQVALQRALQHVLFAQSSALSPKLPATLSAAFAGANWEDVCVEDDDKFVQSFLQVDGGDGVELNVTAPQALAQQPEQPLLAGSVELASQTTFTCPGSPAATELGETSEDVDLADTPRPASRSFSTDASCVRAEGRIAPSVVKTPSNPIPVIGLCIGTQWAEDAPVVQNHHQRLAVLATLNGHLVGLGKALPGWGKPGFYRLDLVPEMCVGPEQFVEVPGRQFLGPKFRPEIMQPTLAGAGRPDISYDADGAMLVEARLWLKSKDLAAYGIHRERLRVRLDIARPDGTVAASGFTPAYRCFCKANTADRNAGGHGSTMRKAAPAPRDDGPRKKRARTGKARHVRSDSDSDD